MLQPQLMPPEELVVAGGIGVSDPAGIADEFHNIGRAIVSDMLGDGFVKPDFHVLDVGCGLGRLARHLVEVISPAGSYQGIDIVKPSIDWCAENYAGYKNFTFVYADIFSNEYNRNGPLTAETYRFPVPDETVDFILSTSLFTHLEVGGVTNYLGEMGRVLKDGGILWNTYCLLDEVSEPLAQETILPFPVEGGLTARPENPEALTGIRTERLLSIYRELGLAVKEIRKGTWSGRPDAHERRYYQDVVIAAKESAPA